MRYVPKFTKDEAPLLFTMKTGEIKDKEISENEQHKAEEEIQKITDIYIKKVDEVLADKEKELMDF